MLYARFLWLLLLSSILGVFPGAGRGAHAQAPDRRAAAPTVVAQTAAVSQIPASDAILIGLDADMSSTSAEAGEAIRRGIVLALQDINRDGGVLGRPLELVIRDHHGNPTRGVDNIAAFAQMPGLVAVVAGVQSVVAVEELAVLHQHRIPLLVPWAAGTPVVTHDYRPNYVFRVSARDEYVGEYLVQQVLAMGYTRPGLLLEQTAWGNSNEKAMTAALRQRGLEPAGVEWIYRGVPDVTAALTALVTAGADVLLLATNVLETIAVVRSMDAMPEAQRRPLVAHWGFTAAGKKLSMQLHESLFKVNLIFLQTYSFLAPPFPERAQRVTAAYCTTFPGCQSARDIFSPVGTAQAYDLVHLLALAIRQAGSTDRAVVRQALEQLTVYHGLIRDYHLPFTAERHDALDMSDYRLARYDRDGAIVPLVPGQ